MAYALISIRDIYNERVFTIYNIKSDKIEYCSESKVKEYLSFEQFVNVKVQDNRLKGLYCKLEDYVKSQKRLVFTCIKAKGDASVFVDSLGTVYKQSDEYILSRCLNKSYISSNEKLNQSTKRSSEESSFRVKTCYISFMEGSDEVICLVDSLYSSKYNYEIKIVRLNKSYSLKSDDVLDISGLKDDYTLYLLNGVGRQVEILGDLKSSLESELSGSCLSLEPYSEDNNIVYVSSLDLSERLLSRLRALL